MSKERVFLELIHDMPIGLQKSVLERLKKTVIDEEVINFQENALKGILNQSNNR